MRVDPVDLLIDRGRGGERGMSLPGSDDLAHPVGNTRADEDGEVAR